MSQLTTRRAFFSAGFLHQETEAIRPPGSDEAGFEDLCTGCSDCVQSCPENILITDAGGLPVLDSALGACTFCGACAQSCDSGALDLARLPDWPWRAAIRSDACLSTQGVSCRLCQDSCDQRAIRFQLQLAGRAKPVLDQDLCTGCGACVAPCPVAAVSIKRPPQPELEPRQ